VRADADDFFGDAVKLRGENRRDYGSRKALVFALIHDIVSPGGTVLFATPRELELRVCREQRSFTSSLANRRDLPESHEPCVWPVGCRSGGVVDYWIAASAGFPPLLNSACTPS
jgi:hypothetical protein